MNKSKAQELLDNMDVIQAFVDGKVIRHNGVIVDSPMFSSNRENYTIEEKPIEVWHIRMKHYGELFPICADTFLSRESCEGVIKGSADRSECILFREVKLE